MPALIQDLRYGARMLARDPGPTLVMTLTLALAIGANTAIFSVVYGVLLRPLPFPKPNQIISVSEVAADGHRMHFADPNFDDLRASNHILIGMAEYESTTDTVVAGGEAVRVGAAAVSHDFFRVMGVAPALGREFGPEDQHPGAVPVALVGYGYWRQHLGRSADLASFKLKMEDKVYSVVGVLPPGFSFPDDTEVWVPRELFEHLESRTAHNWEVVARLRGCGAAKGVADGERSAGAADLAWGSRLPLTRGLRQCGEPHAGSGRGSRTRAGHSYRAGSWPRPAGAAVPGGIAAAVSGWRGSGRARGSVGSACACGPGPAQLTAARRSFDQRAGAGLCPGNFGPGSSWSGSADSVARHLG